MTKLLNALVLLPFGVGIGTIEAFLVATPSNPLKGTGLEKPSAEIAAACLAAFLFFWPTLAS